MNLAMSMCGDELNFWSGNDSDSLPMMSLGAKGVISVIANLLPEVTAKICEFALKEDFVSARKVQMEYVQLMEAMFIEVNPIPIKTAMNLVGMDVGELRLPLCEMEPNNLEKLKKAMRAKGLKV